MPITKKTEMICPKCDPPEFVREKKAMVPVEGGGREEKVRKIQAVEAVMVDADPETTGGFVRAWEATCPNCGYVETTFPYPSKL